MPSTPPPDLSGLTVLVTRPIAQAGALADAVEAAGGRVLRLPALAIEACPEPAALRDLSGFDWLIFVSANAVAFSLGRRPGAASLPPGTRVAAIGAATARALEACGVSVSLQPADTANSEALLATVPLQRVAGQDVLIVRGAGGREMLGRELAKRGARVQYAECYRRTMPDADTQPLRRAWEAGECVVVSVTSVESLANLVRMVDEGSRRRLLDSPLLVVGERQHLAALEQGWRGPVIVARNADPAAMVTALGDARPCLQGH